MKAWGEVEALIATKQPGKYDAAVALLKDLRELAVRSGRREEVERRLGRLHEQHAKKPSLTAMVAGEPIRGQLSAFPTPFRTQRESRRASR